jgi:trehalose 6-phosphate phosphatase
VEAVRDRPRDRDDPDRGERRRRRRPLLPVPDERKERDDDDPAADAEERAEEAGDETDEDEPHGRIVGGIDLLARLAEDPERAAILLDVDGALAPIVPRPEDARVPPETQQELRRLHARYALVACISGRSGEDAKHVVGVPELVYVGNHGLELEPDAEAWAARLRDFLAETQWPRTEDKRLSAALHFRDVEDQAAARATLDEIAAAARAHGFVTRYGRKVLEVLPPLEADKGTAVRGLLTDRNLDRALYAGDDTTDIDAFRALDGLDAGVRVAVASSEGPVALREAADVIVAGPAELLALLRRL